MIAFVLLLLVTALSAAFCHFWAARHGKRAAFWGAMGLLFGPFAIPAVLLVSRQ